MATLTRRSILKEDISFDDAGADATETITRPNGTTTSGHKLNAKHIPLSAATQTQTGQTNVDSAIAAIKQVQIDQTTKDASTTQKGLVELATSAETITGTDTVRAVTPAGLAAVTASATRKGLIEVATVAEAEAGTDTERAVTPAGLKSAIITISETYNWGKVLEICPTWSISAGATTFTVNSPGKMIDDTFQYPFNLNSSMTKDFQLYWVQGDGNGGIANGTTFPASSLFVFAIYNKVTTAVDIIGDSNPNGTNAIAQLGSNWVKRMIGIITCSGASLAANVSAGVNKLRNGTSYAPNFAVSSGNFGASTVVHVDFTAELGTKFAWIQGFISTDTNLAAAESVRLAQVVDAALVPTLCELPDANISMGFVSRFPDPTFVITLVGGAVSGSKLYGLVITAIDVFNYKG